MLRNALRNVQNNECHLRNALRNVQNKECHFRQKALRNNAKFKHLLANNSN